MQTDPAGYADSPNLYAYVLNDPVNGSDPTGLKGNECIIEPGTRICGNIMSQDSAASNSPGTSGSPSSGSPGGFGDGGSPVGGPPCPCISPSDPRAADSLNYWEGYYLGDIWISTRFTSQGFGGRSDFGYNDGAETFGCVGANYFLGAGFCRSSGRTYGYVGLHYPPGFDATVGRIYGGSQNYLTGFSAGGNGLPGAGASLDSNFRLSAVAFQTGTPGGAISYGFDLTGLMALPAPYVARFGNQFMGTFFVFSNGFYNMAGRPYDPDRRVRP